MDLRFLTSLALAKSSRALITKTGGGATAAPGLASLYLDSEILKKLSLNLNKTILITGTNGKTTTSRLIGDFFEKTAVEYVHNRQGSNLERGLVSAFLDKTNFQGEVSVKNALLEVDEAAFSKVVTKLSPTTIVITNLFRDQLDRYGEIDNIKKLWEKAVEALGQNTTLVLNADDASVAFLGAKAQCKLLYFGIEDVSVGQDHAPSAVDSIKCPNCYSDLKYDTYYLSHLGKYHCPNCHFKRPEPQVIIEKIKVKEQGSEFELLDKAGLRLDLDSPLEGIYNIYNCLAAYCSLKAENFDLDTFPLIVKRFQPVFGRAEKLSLDGKNIVVALAKNPTGFNEVIKTFLTKEHKTVLIAINDLLADGRDVSWLWDVDFESLGDFEHRYITSGIRASDMALRLKYASVRDCSVEENLEEALQKSLNLVNTKETLVIIPTYTAMLSLKKIFARKGISGQFWED